MTLTAADVPDAELSPPSPVPSRIRSLIERRAIGRRAVLRSIALTGMVVGLNALDLLPTGRRAHAAPPYSTHTHCNQYGGKTGNPNTDWRYCNPSAADVSSRYCASNGYHRVDRHRIDQGTYEQYKVAYRCAGKNAWEWRKDGVAPEPPNVRCSDGTVTVYEGGRASYTYKSTCRKSL